MSVSDEPTNTPREAARAGSESPVPAVETLAQGRWIALRRQGTWEYATRVRGRAAAVIVAMTDAEELVLIEQYRPAIQARCLELPAGLVGDTDDAPDESVVIAAGRELEEETGFRAQHLELVAQGPASAGLSDEQLHIVRARGLQRVGPGGGDEHENIEVHLVPRDDLNAFVATKSAAGVQIDLKIWAGLFWLAEP